MVDTNSHTYELDMRERLIIAQALVLGINELESVSEPYKEVSNILDMKYLLYNSFGDMAHVAKMMVMEHQKQDELIANINRLKEEQKELNKELIN